MIIGNVDEEAPLKVMVFFRVLIQEGMKTMATAKPKVYISSIDVTAELVECNALDSKVKIDKQIYTIATKYLEPANKAGESMLAVVLNE